MLKSLFKATYVDKNNIQKAELKLLKFIGLSTRIDSNFGSHLWFDTRFGPLEFSFGLRYWDESPDAIKRYEEDFNIMSMSVDPGTRDAS
jgi:hypothetical protein|tara:strand:- start:1423 stop:1689 length:267 start_codon:yes stop_codon:yes gene_type:complete